MGVLLKTFLALLLFSLPAFASAAVLVKPVNNIGLLSYWDFNEGSGSSATDSSGNGNGGTLNGSPSRVVGKQGGGISFTSSTHNVSGTVAASTTAYTVSAWVRYQGSVPISAIKVAVSFGPGGADNTLWMGYASDGSLAVSDSQVDIKSTTVQSSTEWQHVVGVVSGGTLTAYANGVSIGSTAMSARGSSALMVGNYPTASSLFFNGIVDEVKVYNRALTATEVAALYRGGSVTVRANSATQSNPLSGATTAEWTFEPDTVSGSTVYDQSGNNHDFTLTNGATIVPGRDGYVLSLDGTNDYAYGLIGALPTSVSLSMYVKADSLDNQSILTEQGDGAPSSGYHFTLVGIYNGAFYAGFWNIGNISSGAIEIGRWYHVVLAYDGVAHEQRLFVDGVLQGTQSGTWDPPSNIYFLPGLQQQSCSFTSSSGNCGVLAKYFDGEIDDLAAYNEALDQEDVDDLTAESSAIINASAARLTAGSGLATGLVGYWSFDGAHLTDKVYDQSGLANNGYFVGGATSSAKVAGKMGQALWFNGSSQYVQVVGGSYPTGTNPRALCAWVKSDDTTFEGNADHVVNYGTASTNQSFGFMIHTGNQWRFFGFGGAVDFDTGVAVDTNWHHHCVTYDGTTVTYYYDGTSVASQPRTLDTTSGPMVFGTRQDLGAINEFNGSIDEVRVYNRTLSSSEVKQLYLIGR